MFQPTTLYRRSVLVVLVCISAGIIEAGLIIGAVRLNEPNWGLAIVVSRVGMLTSAICLVAGVVGSRQKPTIGIAELGVVAGFISLWLTVSFEAVSHICWVCL